MEARSRKKSGKLLCQYDISKERLSGRSMLVAGLVRNGPWWSLRTLGKPFGDYRTANDLVKHNTSPYG